MKNNFEIGDWVQPKKNIDQTIFDSMYKLKLNKIGLIKLTKEDFEYYDKNWFDGLEKWKPKIKEICWFKNKDMDFPFLSKLINIYDDGDTQVFYSENKYIIKIDNISNIYYQEINEFYYIQPFVGELPMFY